MIQINYWEFPSDKFNKLCIHTYNWTLYNNNIDAPKIFGCLSPFWLLDGTGSLTGRHLAFSGRHQCRLYFVSHFKLCFPSTCDRDTRASFADPRVWRSQLRHLLHARLSKYTILMQAGVNVNVVRHFTADKAISRIDGICGYGGCSRGVGVRLFSHP